MLKTRRTKKRTKKQIKYKLSRFFTTFLDEDYELYKSLMAQWCRTEGVAIWAYCLMSNHVHLIAVPGMESALARAIGEAHRRYTAEINRREGWTGHLWQGRFACAE